MMTTKRKNKTGVIARAMNTIGEMDKGKWLMYAGLGVAAFYGLRKSSFLRQAAIPMLASVAPKYFNGISERVQRFV